MKKPTIAEHDDAHARTGFKYKANELTKLRERVAKLEAACQAAERCLQSIERNESVMDEAVRRADPGLHVAWVSTVAGWKRNLAEARKALEGR